MQTPILEEKANLHICSCKQTYADIVINKLYDSKNKMAIKDKKSEF